MGRLKRLDEVVIFLFRLLVQHLALPIFDKIVI